MINEEIYDLSGGIRTQSERIAYLYSEVSKKYQMRYLFEPMRVLEQKDFIEQYVRGENPFPKSIEIDPTNFCNHDCPFCIYSSLHKEHARERLKNDKLFRLIQECKELGVESILFIGGGEPLAHNKTVDAIKYGNELGMSIGLVTNGSLISTDDVEVLQQNATYVRVSLDGGSAESHKVMHQSNDFDKIIENLSRIAKKPRKSTVGVSYFVNHINVHETLKAVKLVKSTGADYIQIKTYLGIGIANGWYPVLLNEIEEAIKEASGLFSVYVMDNIFDTSQHQVRNYEKCHWQAFKTIIGANGNVYLCTQKRGRENASIGNVNDHSLKDIWDSVYRQETIKNICLSNCPYCAHHTQNKLIDFFASNSEYHAKFY
jgi:GTP 3',8-cyclase